MKQYVDKKEKPSYAFEGYCEETYQLHENGTRQTKTGLIYMNYHNKVPLEEHRMGPLLRALELTNGPNEQEAEIISHSTPLGLKKALSQKPTRLKLFFKDLRTWESVEHMVSIKMPPWSAPCQCLVSKM